MCGRFVLMTPGRSLAKRFGLEEVPDLEPRYNIAPTQMVAMIRLDRDTLQRRLVLVKWGLIPFWAKDSSIGNRLINARAESAAEKPAFRSAFKSRRCLVPADGYYEWKKRKGGQKQPYLARNADGSPFAFAGLWERWQAPEDEIIESCTILTTDANDLTQPIHDRMPVILKPGGIRNSNDLIWVGRSANYAAKLCGLVDGNYSSFITESVYSVLTDETKYGGNPRRSMWEKSYWQEYSIAIYKSNWTWTF